MELNQEDRLEHEIQNRSNADLNLSDLARWFFSKIKEHIEGMSIKINQRYIAVNQYDRTIMRVDIQSRNKILKVGVDENLKQKLAPFNLNLTSIPQWKKNIIGVAIRDKSPSIIDAFSTIFNDKNNIIAQNISSDRSVNDNSISPPIKPIEKHSTPLLSLRQRLSIPYNQILTGAPGTGKTFKARKIAEEFIVEENGEIEDQIEFVQFHPSFDYTDFVEGLRPTFPDENGNIRFERKDGIFKSFCKKALMEKNLNKNFFFIIDEINRGDISKIFGELFFSIDPAYRGRKGMVKTQYSNLLEEDDIFYSGFYVPENLYLIGTMNDIDRSVESIDFAIRRRFNWLEIPINDAICMWDETIPEYKKQALSYLERINAAINEIESLGEAFNIGPAYFLNLKDYNGDFAKIWQQHIAPLLKEYLRGIPDSKNLFHKLQNSYFEIQPGN